MTDIELQALDDYGSMNEFRRRMSSFVDNSEKIPISGVFSPGEVAPDTILYRIPSARPRVADIRKRSIHFDDSVSIEIPREKQYTSFGWFLGVFIPTFINLICITFFVDVTSTIQKAGLGLGLLLFLSFELIAYGTLTNICTIATNGEMKDGGCYFLISRTLGHSFAGAAGIILILSHSTAISTCLYYLSHIITNFFEPKTFTGANVDDIVVLQIGFCIIVFLVGMFGFKTLIYILSFFGLFAVLGVVLLLVGIASGVPSQDSFFVGFSMENFKRNWSPPNGSANIASIGALFSSTNGIMTVADFSGNLNPPQKSITTGGFSALIVSTALFITLIIMIAASVNFSHVPNHSVPVTQLSLSPFFSCINFIFICFGSSLAISSGGARIVKMMMEDGLLPKWINIMTVNNESLGSLLLVMIVGLLFSFIENPKTAIAITNVSFLVPLALSNWAVYTCSSAQYPGFRPTFRYYNKWIALLLTIICIVRAFFIDWIVAISFVVIFVALYYAYSYFMSNRDSWGSILSISKFYTTMKSALQLYNIPPHVKTYRSNIILVTTKTPYEAKPAIDIINQLLHRHGMASIGRIIITQDKPDIQQLINEREGTFLTDDDGYRTFYDVIFAKSMAEGVRDMLLQCGIGVMRPNTLCLEFPESRDYNEFSHFTSSLNVAFDANYSVTVLRNVDQFKDADRLGYIDVWWLSDDGGLTLLLPYLLSKQRQWKNGKLRVITIAFLDEGDEYEATQERMEHLLYKFGIKAEVTTIEFSLNREVPSPMAYSLWRQLVSTSTNEGDIDQLTHRYLVLSDLVRQYSSSSSFIVLTMVVPHETTDPIIFKSWLDVMSYIKVPFLFVRGNGENTLSWTV